MSFIRNTGVCLFPTQFVKDAIKTYTENHGKSPKILVISSEDAIDFSLSCTMPSAASLGLDKIQRADYLDSGEIELCQT
jgi:hypothetical protein